MDKSYFIIVGADQSNLLFDGPEVIAAARVGHAYVSCEAPTDGSNVLHYRRCGSEELYPLNPEDVVLARRLYIDFNAMDDNEIDARYHAFVKITKDNWYFIESVDNEKKEITWCITDKRMGVKRVTTHWAHPEQMLVSTTDFKSVDELCHQYRVSVTCAGVGKDIEWTATSPYFRGCEMKSPSRSRAVVQLILWTYYRANVRAYISIQDIQELLKSHAVEV